MDSTNVFVIEGQILKKYDGRNNTVVIPDHVKIIGSGAFGDFRNCYNVTEITIPAGITEIRAGAFGGCYQLTSITIPETVERIEEGAFPSAAFGGQTKLKEIIVDSGNPFYVSVAGVVYNKDRSELVAYPAGAVPLSFTVPDSVKTIQGCAFRGCTNLESVTLPDNLIHIGEYAFSSCKKLTSINLGKVHEIGQDAFNDCEKLLAVDLDSLQRVEKSTFYDCWELQHVKLGSVEMIEDAAFSGCFKIQNLIFPETVSIIGDNAFSGPLLIEIPKTVNTVGKRSFGCSRAIIIYDNLRGHVNEIGNVDAGARYRYAVFVKSVSDGSLKYVVPMFCDGTWNLHRLLREAWGNNNSFDFSSVDRFFKSIKEPSIKVSIAVIRLLNPFELSEEARKNYESYLSRNAAGIIRQLIDADPKRSDLVWITDAFSSFIPQSIFELTDKLELLKKTNIDELIEYAQKENHTEWLAFLMDWKNKNTDSRKTVPVLKARSFDIGDTITIGRRTWNETDVPMEWIIVDATKKQYLLLSKYLVRKMAFYSAKRAKKEFIGWSRSDVRTWLNGSFLSDSFDDNERNRICLKTVKTVGDWNDTEDYVFIPSEKEFSKYINSLGKKGSLGFGPGSAGTYGYSEMLRKTWLRYSSCCIEVRTYQMDPYFKKPTYYSQYGEIDQEYSIRPMMWISKE